MGTIDLNIEFAHIYVDEQFGDSQKQSIEVLKTTLKLKEYSYRDYTLTVLVDDYHPNLYIFDLYDFIIQLEGYNVKPDYICFESRLIDDCNSLIDQFDKKLSRKFSRYIKNKNKYPCSLLTAVWYLKRLGLMDINDNELIYLGPDSSRPFKPFVGNELITILPLKFKDMEMSSINILKYLLSKEDLDRIKLIFY